MLRWGPDSGPVVVMALPLFEEANRVRAFAVSICRALAQLGVASALPDLPGQGESLVPLESLSLLRIAEGFEGAVDHLDAAGRTAYGFAVRSGTLLDKLGLLHGRYHFTPQTGPDLIRELRRSRQAAAPDKRLGGQWYFDPDPPPDQADPPVEVSGNLISPALLTDLTLYEPWASEDGGPVRTVRLASDLRPADTYVSGQPLWRRSAPGDDPVLAQTLADDIAHWVQMCDDR